MVFGVGVVFLNTPLSYPDLPIVSVPCKRKGMWCEGCFCDVCLFQPFG